MSAAPRFSREEAERRLGPAAVEAMRRNVAAAPPFSPEIRERLRELFATARVTQDRPAADAA